MTAPASAADRPLYRWELAALLLLVAVVGWFGYLTVKRSAFSTERMTDFGVYTRAAWAVRVGVSPYDVVDDRNWHYTYPPPFVLLMTPLADPPAGEDRTGYLPFAASVAVWYVVNAVFAALAVHLLALAVLPDARPLSRRWWYARLIPFDICLPAIGYTLGRGQVNVFVVLLLAAGFLLAVRRRGFASGLLLAAAACVKVVPGLLVLFPLLRKKWRELLGVLAGGVLFLFVVPAAVWGPRGAVEMNETFLTEVVFPGLTNKGSKSREPELIGTANTDSQAFHAVVHAIRHPDRATRPTNSDGISKAVHYLIGLGMLGATAWAFRPPLPWGRGEPVAPLRLPVRRHDPPGAGVAHALLRLRPAAGGRAGGRRPAAAPGAGGAHPDGAGRADRLDRVDHRPADRHVGVHRATPGLRAGGGGDGRAVGVGGGAAEGRTIP